MSEYPQIIAYFKKLQQAQSKMQLIEQNKSKLQYLLNQQEVQKIQIAVEERMGPYMCDNTQKQSNLEKQAFLEVLEDFKKESKAITKLHNEQYNKMKEDLTHSQQQIKATLQRQQNNCQKSRGETQKICKHLFQYSKVTQLKNDVLKSEQRMDQNLRAMENELQILLIEYKIKRRKSMNELLELLHR